MQTPAPRRQSASPPAPSRPAHGPPHRYPLERCQRRRGTKAHNFDAVNLHLCPNGPSVLPSRPLQTTTPSRSNFRKANKVLLAAGRINVSGMPTYNFLATQTHVKPLVRTCLGCVLRDAQGEPQDMPVLFRKLAQTRRLKASTSRRIGGSLTTSCQTIHGWRARPNWLHESRPL